LLQEGTHGYGTLVGDNLCQWHKESLLLVANIPEVDLIYSQFRNGLSLVPYCILLDHQCQSVIVSARGSLSLDDLMTDVNLDPQSLQDLAHEHGFEADDTQFCHAGVVASARNVYSDLERHGLLERLLQQEYPDYQLRLVGHSLGAGVATLLGYMLKARFPSLQVYNFSPPGCTMTWELATRCEAWATSFVLDSDIVPRLSVLTLERLRDEVLDLVGRLKVPKHEVLESFWTGQSRRACFFGATTNHAQQDLEDLNALIEDWLFFEEDEHHREEDENYLDQPPPYQSTIYYRQLQEFRRIQEERRQSRGSTRSILLYPPGRMIHLLKTGEEGGCGHLSRKITTCCTTNSGFQYTPVYIANDDLDEIVVSPTMATDHFIDRMVDELSNLASDYGALMDLGGEIV
jgi:sn1-specific diacylglycerol lipase